MQIDLSEGVDESTSSVCLCAVIELTYSCIMVLSPRCIVGALALLDLEIMRFTRRERECLEWVARGKSSWDISIILNISENTVNFHLKNTMKKLGASRRSVAAIKAIKLGLIDPA
jgi:DNA-binding CsgD family transcriptional regulator